MTTLDPRDETPAEEFSRLIIEYNEGEKLVRAEAWNLIVDFAMEHSDTILRALSQPQAGESAGKNRAQGLVRSMDQWRNMVPVAVSVGSQAQVEYALHDAKHDIECLWDALVAATSPQPANPAQVTDEMLKRAIRAYRDTPEYDHHIALKNALTAAIGAGGQAVAYPTVNELFANCDRWGAVEWFNRLAMAIHNRDKAVVEGNDLSFATYDNIAKSSAARLVHDFEQEVRSALSQPRPADERVVEALQEAKNLLWRLQSVIEVGIDRSVRDRIADFDAFVAALVQEGR